jgi:hypothetical protein
LEAPCGWSRLGPRFAVLGWKAVVGKVAAIRSDLFNAAALRYLDTVSFYHEYIC